MAFQLPELPYAHDALAQHGMSAETLEYHHDLHHKAYVDNGNKLIAGTKWETESLESVITGTYEAGALAQNGIFNNASQHWNHIQFWEMMGPGNASMPSELEKAINEVTTKKIYQRKSKARLRIRKNFDLSKMLKSYNKTWYQVYKKNN